MNGKSFYYLLILCLVSIKLDAQKIDPADSISRLKSAALIKAEFHDEQDRLNHLLFSIADKEYLIVIEKPNEYDEYYFDIGVPSKKEKKCIVVLKPNSVLKKAFNPQLYQKDYISINSDYFKSKRVFFTGANTYFYLMRNGVKIGEAGLTIAIRPNPINKKVYKYLLMTTYRIYMESSK